MVHPLKIFTAKEKEICFRSSLLPNFISLRALFGAIKN